MIYRHFCRGPSFLAEFVQAFIVIWADCILLAVPSFFINKHPAWKFTKLDSDIRFDIFFQNVSSKIHVRLELYRKKTRASWCCSQDSFSRLFPSDFHWDLVGAFLLNLKNYFFIFFQLTSPCVVRYLICRSRCRLSTSYHPRFPSGSTCAWVIQPTPLNRIPG